MRFASAFQGLPKGDVFMKRTLFFLPLLAIGMTPVAAYADDGEVSASDITVSGSVIGNLRAKYNKVVPEAMIIRSFLFNN